LSHSNNFCTYISFHIAHSKLQFIGKEKQCDANINLKTDINERVFYLFVFSGTGKFLLFDISSI